MSDLWQRYQSILEEIRIIKEALKHGNSWSGCCVKFHSDGSIECSRFRLKTDEFLSKCAECKSVIKKWLKDLEVANEVRKILKERKQFISFPHEHEILFKIIELMKE